ncbi:DUF3892 domain-containing protein [Oenococcus sp. UCMA 16435]|nr:DUF3892 domain-containing protein [Oenococcus sp. UCMA 16435]MDN6967809.1 DUF3892 domain-containing protein [Oenococcus sp. UCMA 17063]
MYATEILMRAGHQNDDDLKVIDSIYLKQDSATNWTIAQQPLIGWYKKEDIHRWLVNSNQLKIKVYIDPYPLLEPATDGHTQYVKSQTDNTGKDNLLRLPRANHGR